MHVGVGSFHLLALVMRRASCGQREKLDKMFLQLPDRFRSISPFHRLGAVDREPAAFDAFSLPINPWILHSAGQEIDDNIRNAGFATKPVEERHFSRGLRGFISAT